MLTMVIKVPFVKHLKRKPTAFGWTIPPKKTVQHVEKTLGVGGNSSSVWFTEASTTMSFQKAIRIQTLHHLKSLSLADRLESGSLYPALSQSGWCLY